MDGERFDHLTRRLAQSLSRRRLLRRAAGVLAGAALAGRGARILAACDTPPDCPQGSKSCGGCGCIPEDGVCCTENVYCPPHTICCGNGAGGWNCCAQSEFSQEICCANALCCLVGLECGPDGCRSPCPAGTSRCGETCCSSDQECISDRCQSACATGTTRCGTSNCCGAEQTCAEGKCVDACPVGIASQQGGRRRSRQREVTAEAGCESCPAGTVRCGGKCVPACKRRRSLDGDTCTCTRKTCPRGKTKCGGQCVDTQFDPSHCGGCEGTGGLICLDGICCNGACQVPGSTCCGSAVCAPGQDCCAGGNVCCAAGRCCGATCCPSGSSCKSGTCCPDDRAHCGNLCCPVGSVCASEQPIVCCAESNPYYCAGLRKCASNREACCAEGEALCNTLCCPAGTVCANFERSACCAESHPYYCPRRHKCAEDKGDCG